MSASTRARGAPPRVEPLPSYGASARGRPRSRLARGGAAALIFRRASLFGTHAAQGIKPTSPKCRRESTPEPRGCFGATPLVGELPRSNRQTTAWPSAPSRAVRVTDKVNAGRKSVNLNPGGPSRSSRIAPAETILRRASLFGTHAAQGIKRTSPKCRRESTPEPPDAVLARPLSLASYPVATGRPRPGHQRPRAR